MDSPLRVHVLFLESQIQELNESLTAKQLSIVDRDEIVLQIKNLTRGLEQYREALELEESFHRRHSAPIQNPAKRA